GTVLLKNDDSVLPLGTGEKRLAIFCENSVDFVYGGSGSGAFDTSLAPTLKEALEDSNHGGFTVDSNLWNFYENGAGKDYRKTYPDETGAGSFAVNEVPIDVLKNDTLATSTLVGDDVALVCLGRCGGESSDLPTHVLSTGSRYLSVDKNERDTIKYACEKFDKVVLIVNANNPVELGFLNDSQYENVKSALWIGGVGQEGMYGLADVISGKANPSGRLVDTYAYDSTSAPSFNNFGDYTIANADANTSRANKYLVYGEGIYIGYRYYETRYEDEVLNQGNAGSYDYASTVQFPFGYGLSYSEFEYSNFNVTSQDDDTYEVSVDVKNVGDTEGSDVVEVYLQKPYTGLVETSAVELAGFGKTDILKPNRSETVKVSIDKETFKSYDYTTNKTYVLDDGDYYLAIGNDAHDALNNILAAKGKTTSDGMTADGKAEFATIAYHQDGVDAVTYSTSQENGNKISNEFDEASISYYDNSFKYLTRSNWGDSLVSSSNYKNKSWTAPSQLIEDLKFYRGDEVINDTSLAPVTTSSTATSYKVSDMLDVDYEDSKWDDLVEQLSWKDISKLVRIGGYSTQAIDAIGLPSTTDKDGPAGFSNTLVGGVATMSWPAEVVMSSTWNDKLIENVGEYIGLASIKSGTTGWYAPGVDIHRSPYSGRNFEYFSEDGLLSGKIGAAEMRGVRSKGVIAYMKHFALNDQEINRYGGAMFSNEQEIREVSLKGFEYVVREGGSTAVMTGMNRIGARWAGANKNLMTNVLRNEWGFKGMVITDQASVSAMYYQDIISGLWAGNDIWLNTNNRLWGLAAYDEAIGGLTTGVVNYKENNTVTHYLQKAAKNIIYTVVNSNAVKTYDETVGNVSMFPWKPLLFSLDGVIWAASLVGIILPTTLYLLRRKKEDKDDLVENDNK
ncbi:MAG: glycoside hydrolase family 3 N-terminal domain-containing protein, partial [Bacilli bacterium]|nr:glycoside hydrolase family 3 N-terminal domain-containing protein [Bacilli bacterium]